MVREVVACNTPDGYSRKTQWLLGPDGGLQVTIALAYGGHWAETTVPEPMDTDPRDLHLVWIRVLTVAVRDLVTEVMGAGLTLQA
jgi:hypothetical protein